jgi:hypothetical protein
MKKRWIAAGLGVACLGCCAPLILPLFAGGAAAAGLGLGLHLSLDQLICLGLPVLVLVAAATWWILKRKRKAARACDTVCDVAICGPSGDH